jgi:hypothetical protein
VARAEHVLASCRVREHETIAELYRFKAQHSATRLSDEEIDVGLVRAVVNEQDVHSYLPSFASDGLRATTPDGRSIQLEWLGLMYFSSHFLRDRY